MTLTVFYGGEETATCRRAIWEHSDLKPRMRKIIASGGATILPEPDISLEDAQLPVAQLNEYLRAIAACNVPAICLQDPMSSCVTCDVGSFRFEYFSPDQPPASIKYEWSDQTPPKWKPVIEQIARLQGFLAGLFE